MLRAVLLGVLSIATASGCGSNSDAPKAEPGAPAGKVLEVAGKVTVGAKPLAVGDTIKTDDTIETGADGNVVIELAHNQARWELGPNRKVKPTESAAWTADRANGPAKPVEQVTSAAGRPAERSAADTATSANAAPAKTEAMPAPGAAGAPSGGGPGAPITGAAPPPPSPPPPPPPPKAAMPSRGDDKKAEPPALEPQAKADVAATTPEGSARAPTNVIASFSTCLAKGQTVHLKVHIAHHVPAIEFVGDVDPKVKTCMISAAKKLKLPIESGDMSLDVTR